LTTGNELLTFDLLSSQSQPLLLLTAGGNRQHVHARALNALSCDCE